jgi:hypothetical protein
MIVTKEFVYTPNEHEAERASFSYIMSLIGIIAALPLPVINLITTLAYYFAYRKSTYFVRWHCTQALISQFSVLIFNGAAFWWTVSIIFTDSTISENYIVYMIIVLILNVLDIIATIYSTIVTRKGLHVEWWFWGSLTNMICKP